MIYLTTDTHFNHDKMVEYCGRPKNFENIIKLELIKTLDEDDTLIHLGDVCIGNDILENNFFAGLPCKTILIKGNHDLKSNEWYINNGWDFVCDRLDIKLEGKMFCFSHTPMKDCGEFDYNIHGHFHNALPRLLRGEYVVEGEKERNHHDISNLTEKHRLLALEYTNYKPVELKSFIKNYKSIC